ncbi:hypothetical protein SLS58_000026 [Diplodia intermedia]|uniref:Uncharacterized protein n=1 Tax=Diplodia intermedia TaxID=856260 RepID=A0ABR3U4J5_9PEZI
MADAPSSTPPPQQEQPVRPASFGATWNESDASFLQPGAVPLPKAHRAWERQPHSPFKRNGKYRKVWKRYELRSEPDPQPGPANMEKKSPAKSPRKVVKKRALDVPADPTATPGRRAPKSKAFAPTRWETPRRHSGRIASRKIAQPIFARDPSPELAHADDLTSTTKDIYEDGGVEKDVQESLQKELSLDDMQDQQMAGVQKNSEVIPVPATDAKLEDDTTAEDDEAKESQLETISSESVSQNLAVEEESEPQSIEATEEPNVAGPDLEAPAIAGPSSPSQKATDPEIQQEFEDMATVGDSIPEETSPGAVESISGEEQEQADHVQSETDMAAQSASPIEEEKRVVSEEEGEQMQEQSEEAEVVADAATEDQTPHNFSEAQPAESSVQNDSKDEQTVAEANVDTTTKDAEQLSSETSANNPLFTENAITQEEYNMSLEQQLQTDAAEALGSDSALDEDEASLSDEETDETEVLDENGFMLTEDPESDEDDAANIPSPSLSAAESPKFSSIADTLTLNLPDRTPPKNRPTQEITEEPASPIDEDTAFLKDFLSRAGASKASREATVTQLETMTKRRDSDVVRQALSSPRMALESKDPNSHIATSAGSPSLKANMKDSEDISGVTALDGKKLDFGDLTSDLTLEEPAEEPPAPAPAATTPKPQSNRRSSRARQTRLPATPAAGPNRIQFRGAAGADPVVLKKSSDAQEMAAVTRTNTRKNKGSALAAPIRLNKLKAESLKAGTVPDAPAPDGSLPVFADPDIDVWQASKLRWDGQLVYFQEQGNLAGLTSLSDDESAEPAEIESSAQEKKEEGGSKKRKDKSGDSSSTPARTKRARGLGAGNGTPAKGLLAPASLLPGEVQAETEKIEPAGQDGKEKKSSSGKKASALPAPPSSSKKSGGGIVRGGKKADKTTTKEAPQPAETAAPPLPQEATTTTTSKSDTVKLPVPVAASSSSIAPAAPSPAAKPTPAAPAAQQQQQHNSNNNTRLIGSTPRKMAGIARPSGGDAGNAAAAAAATQGLSAGRRRTATAAAAAAAGRRG